MPADAGIRFGQYVLLRRIARGGMAEVFLAQQRGLEGFDRRVAVKRILPHLADSPEFVKMFLGEAKLAAQLSHPNIVHIYEFGKVDHDYFIAMEFVDGVHAGQLFKVGETGGVGRLTPTLVARIGADAATALHHAHELRGPTGKPYELVHRDVSPANIMVSFDGVVKLCDFGIAKAAAVGDQLTNPGQVKGKYAYMSPEQTIASPLDGRSDVFSLAIVMWELLTGKYIVQRGDSIAAMRALRDGKIEPIERAAPDVPAPLAKAITWALEPKREQRATASDFAQALEAFIKSSPELATAMQLGAWVRTRFTREQTGQHSAIVAPAGGTPGTAAVQGTVVASGTQGPVTPPALGPSATVAPPGTEILSSLDLDENAATFKGPPPRNLPTPVPIANERTRRAIEEPTVRAGPPIVVEEADTLDSSETIERSGARKAPIPSGPAVVPTQLAAAVSGPRPRISDSSGRPVPGSGPRRQLTPPGEMRRRFTPVPAELARKRRAKLAVAVVGLVGLAVISFVIALAVSSSHGKASPRAAAPADAPPAPADAPPSPADAAQLDAAPPPTTLLEVRTIPEGGTIKIGDQSRAAPAQLALDAGHHVVTAELAGYQPERREVDLERGEHEKIEIAFTRKILARGEHPAPVGRLTARTTPYSEVFEGDKRLGETPFADLDLPAGTHVLTFKNPSHPTVTKTIKIVAGKPTKLNFNLP